MRRAFSGVALFFALAAAGCKGRSADVGAASSQSSTVDQAKPTNIVMAINLGEEDEAGGCGDVIHAVRAAAKKGVRTREIDTRNEADMEAGSKKYKIVVQPTVVLLDDADKEVRRFEGESKETIASLKAVLDSMPTK